MRAPLTLLITAAGAGRRFRDQGIKAPKPMIHVGGRTLLEHTLDSFELHDGDTLLITSQRRHNLPSQLDHRLRCRWPGVRLHWFELDALPPGQLATAQMSIQHWLKQESSKHHHGDPLLIHNCDTGFRWSNACLPGKLDASMAVFEAEGDHWSFAQADPDRPDRAIAIAEKKRISSHASIGLYGFSSMERFCSTADWQLKHAAAVKGEHYIAPLLQTLINKGCSVGIPKVDGIRLYGTPTELCNTFELSLDQLVADNQ